PRSKGSACSTRVSCALPPRPADTRKAQTGLRAPPYPIGADCAAVVQEAYQDEIADRQRHKQRTVWEVGERFIDECIDGKVQDNRRREPGRGATKTRSEQLWNLMAANAGTRGTTLPIAYTCARSAADSQPLSSNRIHTRIRLGIAAVMG